MSHISRVFHFAICPKIKREDREFAGKLVSRAFWEREPNTVQWKPWSSSANGKCYILLSRPCEKKDFSMVATIGNVSSLVLRYFWTNLFTGITASRWNVTTFSAVYDRTTTLLNDLGITMFTGNNCLETFVALFRKKIFGKISL